MLRTGISRRKFLIGSAAGGASLVAASYLNSDSQAAVKPTGKEVRVVPTLCDACGNWCAFNVYTKGGRVWKAEGNPIAGNNLGRICAKGHGMLHEVYNPDRIKSPLKRVSPGKFEPISWEQAYKEIGEKLGAISQKDGPESIFWVQYPEGNADLTYRFMRALGSPNVFSHGTTCFLPRNIGWWLTVGDAKPEHDFENSRFVLFIGRNPAAGLQLRQLRDLSLAAQKGARLVVVDPRFSEAAVLGREWIRIRPGTDLALLLAMAHVIIKEGLYQKEFVEKYTEGFEEWANKVKDYTPEWAAEKTSIPKDVIVKLSHDIAKEAPRAVIHRGYHGAMGTQYKNSLQLVRAVACVNGLLGNFNQLGGLYIHPHVKLGKLDPQKYPEPPEVEGPMSDGSTDPDRYPLTPAGIGICTAEHDQKGIQAITDGNEGAIFTWQDKRNGSDYDIYAQKVDGSGRPQWTINGVAICATLNNQYDPRLIADGNGGAIIAWQDYRKGSECNFDAFAEQMELTKTAVCPEKQSHDWNIYTQSIASSGRVKWVANGVSICTANTDQFKPQLATDGSGGAIIIWSAADKERDNNIYGQHLNSSGLVKWTAAGVPVTLAPGEQYDPVIIADGRGGAIVTWYDKRKTDNCDIYAQKI